MSLLAYTIPLCMGVLVTLSAWITAGLISGTIGFVLGIASSRFCAFRGVATAIRVYTFVTKGIPAYVHILIAYFALPALLGINLPGFVAATFALGVCSSGYTTEIVRAGINAVPRGQWEACYVLGFSLIVALRCVILPQAVRAVLPVLCGEFEQLLKSSSLLATIGVTELTRAGMNIISRELNPIPVYLTIAGVYLLMSGILQLLVRALEKRLHYD